MAVELKDNNFSNEQLQIVLNSINSDVKEITTFNIANVIVHGMNASEKIVELKGEDKKKLVLAALQEKINNSEIAPLEKSAIKLVVDRLAPSMIDLLCESAKGMYEFGVKKIKSKWCCAS